MLTVNISTPERLSLRRENIEMISAMGVEGEFAILPNHIPFLTKIKDGIIKMRTDKKQEFTLANAEGFLQVTDNLVTIITDAAVTEEDISRQKAEEARKKAQEALQKRTEGTDFKKVEAELRKSLLELKLLDHLGK